MILKTIADTYCLNTKTGDLDQRPSIYTKKTRDQHIDRMVVWMHFKINEEVYKKITAPLDTTSLGCLDENWYDYIPKGFFEYET